MELNKNKMIFSILGGLILLSIIFLLVTISNKDKKPLNTSTGTDVFKIWIFGDNASDGVTFIDGFKNIYPEYKNKQILLESFSSYEDYTYTLMSAINSGVGPDIFVLNNNEKTGVFSNQVLGVDTTIVNPNDFRKKYKGLFSDDLMSNFSDETGTKEFLTGIPIGYETLGIFYNRKYIKDSDLKNLSSLNNVVSDLRNKHSDLIPIGIGNGSTVYKSFDILTQFFMLEGGVSGIGNLNGKVLKQATASYLLYGDTTGYNGYNSRFQELKDTKKDSLYLFSRGEVLMVVGYPSMIKDIKKDGFSKSMLQATPFPHNFSGGGKTLVDYNYFAINKNSLNVELAQKFMGYIYSDVGATSYLAAYPYYLPALMSLESDKLQQKIDSNYTIILGDFYNDSYELSSFDKGVKNFYDNTVVQLLDNNIINESTFNNFKDSIICKTNKIVSFTNLSANCN